MAENIEDIYEIDINRLVSSIEEMMPNDLLMSSKCCIFKTPSILSQHNKKAYIPDAFSIGPLHHDNPNLKATEEIKVKYLRGLLSRLNYPDLLRTLIGSIIEVEKCARECYAVAFDYNPEQLVKILVIDGCFIIELLLKFTDRELREEGDPIFSRSGLFQSVFHDLVLLENQVPWMVLERLFNLTKGSRDDKNPLIVLALNFICIIHFSKRMPPRYEVINIEGIKHFVDLFRVISIISSSTDPRPAQTFKHFVDLFRKLTTLSSTLFQGLSNLLSDRFGIFEEDRREWAVLPSATRLVEYGIKFKRGTSESILNVRFYNGILEIPQFKIHDITETVFRNIISYEQCYPNCPHSITSYAVLLDNLINTSKDIDILCKNGIIDNSLNSEDAAHLFNTLCLGTLVNYHYNDLCMEVNSFCRRRWPRWRAKCVVLVRKYSIISTSIAVIALFVSFIQTWYSIKS